MSLFSPVVRVGAEKVSSSSSESDERSFKKIDKSIEIRTILETAVGPSQKAQSFPSVSTAVSRIIKPQHRDWFTNQALLRRHMAHANEVALKQIQLAILHYYSKIAKINELQAERLGIQTSPLLPEENGYHRVTRTSLVTKIDEAFAHDLGFKEHEIHLVDSPLIREAIAREMPHPKLDLAIATTANFSKLIDRLLEDAKSGQFSDARILVDISKLIDDKQNNVIEIRKIVNKLEDIVIEKLNSFFSKNSQINKNLIADKLVANLHLTAFIKHKEEHVMLIPEFLLVFPDTKTQSRFEPHIQSFLMHSSIMNRHGDLDRLLYSMISRNGYRLCPIQAKAAWLKVKDLHTLLREEDLFLENLSPANTKIPKVCINCSDFIQQPVVAKFKALSKGEDAAPYLKVLPEATVRLLKGLNDCLQGQGGIDHVFEKNGITDILQISYFRMLEAMNEAIRKKEDIIAFQNQIELIHQEIQLILAIGSPYDKNAFAKSVAAKIAGAPDSMIPTDLDIPKIHLKPSAMHGFSSILSSVEAQKGHNNLHVAVLKNSYYYQSEETLKLSKPYRLSVLDSDRLDEGIEKAFEKLPEQPVDLFIAQFHHNIMLERQSYYPEDITRQIKEMHKHGLLAKGCTILLDTTIDLEQSDDVRNFLYDATVKKLIQGGEINVVLLRSAQKFDMLGIDNYYGGITISVNNDKFFSPFNKRMSHIEDQSKGLCYQGLTHLQRYSGKNLDDFRKEIMSNTQKLYAKLPKASIYRKGSKNPLQISKIKDNRLFFLDIKFPGFPNAAQAFRSIFFKYASAQKLPFTSRTSFGFSNTTLTIIDGKKIRLNPGLEDAKTIDCYARFFQALQKNIALCVKKSGSLDPKEFDKLLANSIRHIE